MVVTEYRLSTENITVHDELLRREMIEFVDSPVVLLRLRVLADKPANRADIME